MTINLADAWTIIATPILTNGLWGYIIPPAVGVLIISTILARVLKR